MTVEVFFSFSFSQSQSFFIYKKVTEVAAYILSQRRLLRLVNENLLIRDLKNSWLNEEGKVCTVRKFQNLAGLNTNIASVGFDWTFLLSGLTLKPYQLFKLLIGLREVATVGIIHSWRQIRPKHKWWYSLEDTYPKVYFSVVSRYNEAIF